MRCMMRVHGKLTSVNIPSPRLPSKIAEILLETGDFLLDIFPHLQLMVGRQRDYLTNKKDPLSTL